MTDPTKARIYLATARHCFEDESFRRYATYPGGHFRSVDVLNDETLADAAKLALTANEGSLRVLVPLAGSIRYKDDNGNNALVEAGQVLSAFVERGSNFEIANTYDDRAVRLLNISFPGGEYLHGDLQIDNFDLTASQNQLLNILSRNHHSIRMGKFDGRHEGALPLSNRGTFVHVIHGAFEVQHRLLEAGDSLEIWNTDLLEFEALSNEANIMIIPL